MDDDQSEEKMVHDDAEHEDAPSAEGDEWSEHADSEAVEEEHEHESGDEGTGDAEWADEEAVHSVEGDEVWSDEY